jgi:hypothetical protein
MLRNKLIKRAILIAAIVAASEVRAAEEKDKSLEVEGLRLGMIPKEVVQALALQPEGWFPQNASQVQSGDSIISSVTYVGSVPQSDIALLGIAYRGDALTLVRVAYIVTEGKEVQLFQRTYREFVKKYGKPDKREQFAEDSDTLLLGIAQWEQADQYLSLSLDRFSTIEIKLNSIER